MKPNHPSNPMRELLRQELGIDAFALDGETSPVIESWSERPRGRGGRREPEAVLVR